MNRSVTLYVRCYGDALIGICRLITGVCYNKYVLKTKKVAIVCDWLTGVGGAERVILAVHEMYPDAPIYTSQFRPSQATWFSGADVRTGWLNILPAGLKRVIPFLRQWYFSHLDLTEYDIVISVTGAEAKAVKTRKNALHVCYMHAPTQYYWTLYDQYIKDPGFVVFNPVVRVALKALIKPLRRADYRSAQNPDIVVANSSYIKEEIKKHYHRDSIVIPPNVDVTEIQKLAKAPQAKREGFIIYGRQVSWKRFDIAIMAAKLSNEKLLVIGDGPEHHRLVQLADGTANISFLPRYNGIKEIVTHIQSSRAFLFPSLEPFGIAPVEAIAAGTPVIGLKKGGALDIVEEGINGVFFDEQTAESMMEAIKRFDGHTFDTEAVKASATKFSEEKFKKCLAELIEKAVT